MSASAEGGRLRWRPRRPCTIWRCSAGRGSTTGVEETFHRQHACPPAFSLTLIGQALHLPSVACSFRWTARYASGCFDSPRLVAALESHQSPPLVRRLRFPRSRARRRPASRRRLSAAVDLDRDQFLRRPGHDARPAAHRGGAAARDADGDGPADGDGDRAVRAALAAGPASGSTAFGSFRSTWSAECTIARAVASVPVAWWAGGSRSLAPRPAGSSSAPSTPWPAARPRSG